MNKSSPSDLIHRIKQKQIILNLYKQKVSLDWPVPIKFKKYSHEKNQELQRQEKVRKMKKVKCLEHPVFPGGHPSKY